MRVIAGIAKGHKLFAPSGLKVRPTSDRVKEALFSILSDKVQGSLALDLFAGSGALGIEALSRGSAGCIFVESDRRAVAAIEKNLQKTNFQAKAEILKSSASEALDRLFTRGQRFDLIFLDPPYRIRHTELKEILEKLSSKKLIKPAGKVVLEHSSKINIIEILELVGLCADSCKKYGDTCLTFYSLAQVT